MGYNHKDFVDWDRTYAVNFAPGRFFSLDRLNNFGTASVKLDGYIVLENLCVICWNYLSLLNWILKKTEILTLSLTFISLDIVIYLYETAI